MVAGTSVNSLTRAPKVVGDEPTSSAVPYGA
jgi:hypothetical protein